MLIESLVIVRMLFFTKECIKNEEDLNRTSSMMRIRSALKFVLVGVCLISLLTIPNYLVLLTDDLLELEDEARLSVYEDQSADEAVLTTFGGSDLDDADPAPLDQIEDGSDDPLDDVKDEESGEEDSRLSLTKKLFRGGRGHKKKQRVVFPEEQRPVNRLEFIHITKTAGTAIEKAASEASITWGHCHYMKRWDLGPGCQGNWKNFANTRRLKEFQGELWHTPPSWLDPNPYEAAEKTFTIVRNPYERIISEYYCKFFGFFRSSYSGVDRKRRSGRRHVDSQFWHQLGESIKADGSKRMSLGARPINSRFWHDLGNQVGAGGEQHMDMEASLEARRARIHEFRQRMAKRMKERKIEGVLPNYGRRLEDIGPYYIQQRLQQKMAMMDRLRKEGRLGDYIRQGMDPSANRMPRNKLEGQRNFGFRIDSGTLEGRGSGPRLPDKVVTFNMWIRRTLRRPTMSTGHALPQHYYVYDDAGNQVVDHILRFENLDVEFAQLMTRYGLNITLPHGINQGHNAGSRFTVKDLQPKTIQVINDFYRKDFELFGYSMMEVVEEAPESVKDPADDPFGGSFPSW